ncbi:uncharacterized protein LOC113094206 [Carassius auratus]|uniref:Uncharacterized protein LOC113094206 n=1 Tax=Carassius auratus TaxID=7957 RepID=A0A6P6P3Y3_CARAU|nr:uncharacterized protein LOC113094206 [Carassius auratus]
MFQVLVLFCLCWRRLLGVFGAETQSVMEGDSVTLNSDLTEICADDVSWSYRDTNSIKLAKINRQAKTSFISDVPDERFRDRLKLDDQTGSLTITNITTEHTGVYQLEIDGAKLISKTFSVSVYAPDGASPSHTVSLIVLIAAGSLLVITLFGIFCIHRRNRKTDQEAVDDLVVAVQSHDEEIIYADVTFYKRNPQEMTATEDKHVEYSTVHIRL